MASNLLSKPAFGEADLSNCEREQIHLAASIQPHGALLLCREPDGMIVQSSINAGRFFGMGESVVGLMLDDLPGDLAARIHPCFNEDIDGVPVAIRCALGTRANGVDAIVHRPAGGGVLIELEPAGEAIDVAGAIETALQTIVAANALETLVDAAARLFKDLTGYDRVMIYKFDDEGHGEVLAEQRETGLEAYLGNRYPATDIPQIARRLYERNRVRMLVDVGFTPVPLEPRHSPVSGADLDMSFCTLRSSSPIHVQYLKNMGVSATLVVSIMVGGRLWGLVSCHHYQPRFVQIEIRAACECLAEAVATRIAALESFVQAQAELSARRLEQRMVEALAREGDWKDALFNSPSLLLQPVRAGGAALIFDGQVLTTGDVPGTFEFRDIVQWLDQRENAPLIMTASLSGEAPRFSPMKAAASGLLAVKLAATAGAYLIWVRPEQVRTVTWGAIRPSRCRLAMGRRTCRRDARLRNGTRKCVASPSLGPRRILRQRD